jgi:hypothetical protein
VRLVDAVAGGGGVGRRRAGFLARALARSHCLVLSRTGIPASRGLYGKREDAALWQRRHEF